MQWRVRPHTHTQASARFVRTEMNHSSSSATPLQKVLLVVRRGSLPSRNEKRMCVPKVLSVPVPVRSPRCTPESRTFRHNSRYCSSSAFRRWYSTKRYRIPVAGSTIKPSFEEAPAELVVPSSDRSTGEFSLSPPGRTVADGDGDGNDDGTRSHCRSSRAGKYVSNCVSGGKSTTSVQIIFRTRPNSKASR